MDSNTHHTFQPPSSGLLRLRSAPSSLVANFSDGSESQRLISRFMNYSTNSTTDSESSPRFQEFEDKSSIAAAAPELVNWRSSQHGFPGWPPHYPRQSSSTNNPSSSSSMDTSYGLIGSNLSRQSSSSAGLFSHLSLPNGYGNYRAVNGNKGGEISPVLNKLKSQLSLSSPRPPPSSLGILSQTSEIENESILGNSPSWSNDSSPSFMEYYSGFKRERDNQMNNGEIGHNRVHLLSHHLSLPKSSSDVVAMEKLLQFQDAVPCKIRAKRGCATHPRSIAERVRRTRISERMRKLQELVPNMDKQTNTADMLDLAVDYIKDLQKQFQSLSDNRAKCKCLSLQKPAPNQIV